MQRLPVGIGIVNAVPAGERFPLLRPGAVWTRRQMVHRHCVELVATVRAAIRTCRDIGSDGCWVSHALALPDWVSSKQAPRGRNACRQAVPNDGPDRHRVASLPEVCLRRAYPTRQPAKRQPLERVTERLPELLDARALRSELSVTRAAAEAIMRRLPVVQIEGLRKVYVRRSDVVAYLEARTFSKTEVPS